MLTLQIKSKGQSPILAVFPMVTSSQTNAATEFQAQINYHANANFLSPFHKNNFIGFFAHVLKMCTRQDFNGMSMHDSVLETTGVPVTP